MRLSASRHVIRRAADIIKLLDRRTMTARREAQKIIYGLVHASDYIDVNYQWQRHGNHWKINLGLTSLWIFFCHRHQVNFLRRLRARSIFDSSPLITSSPTWGPVDGDNWCRHCFFAPRGHSRSLNDGTGFIDKQIGLKKKRQLSFCHACSLSLIQDSLNLRPTLNRQKFHFFGWEFYHWIKIHRANLKITKPGALNFEE